MNRNLEIRYMASLAWILFLCAIDIVPPASAQQEEVKWGEDELQIRLENLKRELAVEREALYEAREAWSQALDDKMAERRKLAERLMDEKIELERLKERNAALSKEAEKLEAEKVELQDVLHRLLTKAESTTEHLLILLRETPFDQQAIPRAQQVLQDLKEIRDTHESEKSQGDLQNLFGLLNRVHHEATHLLVKQGEIRTAGGYLQEVTMLAAGRIAYAYVTTNDARIGLAFSSPSDATGYRWSEKISHEVTGKVKQAIAQAGANGSGVAILPMDPTRRLRVDSRINEEPLVERLAAGGPVMYPLAGVAILALLILIERMWWLYLRNADRTTLARRVLTACIEKRYDEAERMLDKARGAVTRTLGACLHRRNQGTQAMEDGIQEQLLHELPRLRRFMAGLAILAAVAPLLGLLGTVTGIIQTFGVICAFGNANPGLMAGGISEALITTATGLVIAIPILLLRGAMHSRMEKVLGDAERHAASLLNILARNG